MKKAKYGAWILIVIIIAAMILVYYLTKPNISEREEKLAKCLSEKGVVLYSNNGCPVCRAQQADFGNAVQYLKDNPKEYEEIERSIKTVLGYPFEEAESKKGKKVKEDKVKEEKVKEEKEVEKETQPS